MQSSYRRLAGGRQARRAGLLAVLVMGSALSGCADLPRRNVVKGPTTAQPVPAPRTTTDGSVFQGTYNKPLFSDRRPRKVGDVITVVLNENLNATKSSSSAAARKGSVTFSPTSIPQALGSFLTHQGTNVSGGNNFQGSGNTDASNTFTGKITVTVTKVLANGNLQVAGEKEIALNQGTEYLLFSGVVNPDTIGSDSTVTSTQVANARLEYYGNGYMSEAQHMGWLQRVLLNISPL